MDLFLGVIMERDHREAKAYVAVAPIMSLAEARLCVCVRTFKIHNSFKTTTSLKNCRCADDVRKQGRANPYSS